MADKWSLNADRRLEPDDMSADYVRHKREATEQAAAQTMLRPSTPAKPGAAAKDGKSWADTATAVAGDVATGLTIDVPRAFTHGVRDAVQETLDLAKAAAEWLDENVAHVQLVDPTGSPTLEKVAAGQIPESWTLEPQSVTGGLLKQAFQFMAGFKGAGAVVKGAGVAASTAKSALATFAAFDEHEGNLANLWQQAGLPENVLTEYLASSPDDTMFEGRFKNALADAGLGVAVEGLAKVGRALRSARQARQNPPAPDVIGESAALPQVEARDFGALGDPDAPDVVRVKPAPAPIELGVPDEVAAKGMAGSARDAAMAAGAAPAAPAPAALPNIKPNVTGPLATQIIDDHAQARTFADNLGLSAEIERLAAEGQTAQQVGKALEGSLDPARLPTGGPGVSPVKARTDFVRLVRNTLGIPSQDQATEFAAWKAGLAARGESATPTAPTVDPNVFLVRASDDPNPRGGRFRDYFLNEVDDTAPDKTRNRAVVTTSVDGDTIKIDGITSTAAGHSAASRHTVGRRLLQQLAIAIKQDNPDAKYLAGERISGMRVAGAMVESGEGVDAKISLDALIAHARVPGATLVDQAKARDYAQGVIEARRAPLPDVPVGKPHEPEFEVNWARIDAPEDVENVMAQMADAFRPDLETARRGKVTFVEIKLGADQKKAWTELSSRRTGEPMSAEGSVAARNLWASSGTKLTEVAELAATNPSEANLFAFRKMMAVHKTIQEHVIAARTETARALASWRIPATADALRAREIGEALDAHGGADVTRDLAARVAFLSKRGLTKEKEKFVADAALADTGDMVQEAWINGLLWSTKTHLANLVSNTSVMGMTMAERAVAARLSRLLGTQGGVEMGEAAAQWGGMLGSVKDGLRAAWKMMRHGEATPLGDPKRAARPGTATKQDTTRAPAITATNVNALTPDWLNVADGTAVGRAINGLGNLARTPGRSLSAGDQLFKTMGYRMELHSQAERIAKQEARGGMIPEAMLKDRIAEIIRDPPASVQMAAIDQALYQTFNSAPSKFAAKMMALKNDYPQLNVLIPFVRTVDNIFRYSLERTPLAPLSRRFKDDIRAGGARQDLALTQMAVGSFLMATFADLAMQGYITGNGPRNKEAKAALVRSGWQPNSIKIGKNYFGINRLDPTAFTITMAADLVDILHNTEWDKADNKSVEDLGYAVGTAIAGSVFSKNYMMGPAALAEAIGDTKGEGAEYFLQRMAGSIPAFVPGAVQLEAAIDPALRDARSMLEAVWAKTPFFSDDLPQVHDLWGRPRSYESGLGWAYDAFSPIYYRRRDAEPIDRAIVAEGWTFQEPPRRQSFGGIVVDLDKYPGAYQRFKVLSGQLVKLPWSGKNMLETLNDLVTGNSPQTPVFMTRSRGPDGGQEAFLKSEVMSPAYRMAREALLNDPKYRLLALEAGEMKRKRVEREMNAAMGLNLQ